MIKRNKINKKAFFYTILSYLLFLPIFSFAAEDFFNSSSASSSIPASCIHWEEIEHICQHVNTEDRLIGPVAFHPDGRVLWLSREGNLRIRQIGSEPTQLETDVDLHIPKGHKFDRGDFMDDDRIIYTTFSPKGYMFKSFVHTISTRISISLRYTGPSPIEAEDDRIKATYQFSEDGKLYLIFSSPYDNPANSLPSNLDFGPGGNSILKYIPNLGNLNEMEEIYKGPANFFGTIYVSEKTIFSREPSRCGFQDISIINRATEAINLTSYTSTYYSREPKISFLSATPKGDIYLAKEDDGEYWQLYMQNSDGTQGIIPADLPEGFEAVGNHTNIKKELLDNFLALQKQRGLDGRLRLRVFPLPHQGQDRDTIMALSRSLERLQESIPGELRRRGIVLAKVGGRIHPGFIAREFHASIARKWWAVTPDGLRQEIPSTPGEDWLSPIRIKMSPVEVMQVPTQDGFTMESLWTQANQDIVYSGASRPLIINIHGGPHSNKKWSKSDITSQFFASYGAHVVTVNFPGSTGFSKSYREGVLGWDKTPHHIKSLIDYMHHDRGITGPCIVMGHSYGATAAVNTLARYPDLIQHAIGVNGVYDFWQYFVDARSNLRSYVPVSLGVASTPETEQESHIKPKSIYSFLNSIPARSLTLITGLQDRAVPPSHTLGLANALYELGTSVSLHTLKGIDHNLTKEYGAPGFQLWDVKAYQYIMNVIMSQLREFIRFPQVPDSFWEDFKEIGMQQQEPPYSPLNARKFLKNKEFLLAENPPT